MLFIYIWIIFFRASVRRITSFISIIVVETDAIAIKVGHRIDTLKWYTDGSETHTYKFNVLPYLISFYLETVIISLFILKNLYNRLSRLIIACHEVMKQLD